MMSRPRPLAGHVSMTIPRRFEGSALYVVGMLVAALMAVVSLVGCAPADAQASAPTAAAHEVAPAAAPTPAVVVAEVPAITAEQAKAIAWTVAVAEHDKFMAALMPKGTTWAMWKALLKCEGGGNIRAVNRSGKYRTGFQMDRSFWLSYGGPNARAYLPRYEQAPEDMIWATAWAGYRARGRSPWTADHVKCGIKAGLPAGVPRRR